MRGHRIDIRQSERFNHYPLMSGEGFTTIHGYNTTGSGFFSKLVSAGQNMVKTHVGALKDHAMNAAHHGLKTGVKSFLQTGNLQNALMDAGKAGGQHFVDNARKTLTGKGHGHTSRKRARPIY